MNIFLSFSYKLKDNMCFCLDFSVRIFLKAENYHVLDNEMMVVDITEHSSDDSDSESAASSSDSNTESVSVSSSINDSNIFASCTENLEAQPLDKYDGSVFKDLIPENHELLVKFENYLSKTLRVQSDPAIRQYKANLRRILSYMHEKGDNSEGDNVLNLVQTSTDTTLVEKMTTDLREHNVSFN